VRHYPPRVTRSPLTIAQVTPYTWGSDDEVNEFVAGVSAELDSRGHRVVVAAPVASRRAVRRSAKTIDGARETGRAPGEEWSGERLGADGPPVVPIGQGIPIPRGPKPRAAPFPFDISGTLETLLTGRPFDIVHVHDPFAPSASSAALRHSRALNVGSFHEPTERILSTQVARPLVEIFLGRLDARTVVGGATGELMERFFPGTYERVPSGAAAVEPRWPGPGDAAGREAAGDGRPVRIAYCAREERGALRLVLRALRRLSLDLPWEVAIWLGDEGISTPNVSRALADRLTFVRPETIAAAQLVAGADVTVMASGGPKPAPRSIYQAFAAGTIPVASRIEPDSEVVGEEETGLMFPAGDEITLAGQLERLVSAPGLRAELAAAVAGRARSWSSVTDDVEAIYERLSARRHDGTGNPEVRRRISSRPTIDCDLHMHTDHSNDCATPVEVLLETAKDRGMGAIAVTDHNEISGALAAREAAERDGGIKVIVGEEVKTAEQGEVIGLFLEEKIERGMTMRETIDEIRRQGGLVYVPHPFDRLHSVPDYEHLLDIVEDIDILEVFNPRVAFSAFNEEAERFAAKYRIVPGAGSDGHVAQALGSVRIRLHDFDGPEEFLEAMRSADIVRKHKNLVYVQALKWMQAASGQAGGRKQVTDPKPVQGGRRKEARRARSARRRRAAGGGKS
jgi:predicted metal-dependent phosphoesterase TrpH/glycosyltransferase involved in cell wall biosynthesis